MSSEQITVTVGLDGTTVVKVEGYRGSGCKGLTEGLEKALGKTTATKTTPEYAQQPTVQKQVGQR